jgi:hypothetical protein
MQNPNNLSKEKIIEELQKSFGEVLRTVPPIADGSFFKRSDSKWSIADNLEHLALSVKPVNLAFR